MNIQHRSGDATADGTGAGESRARANATSEPYVPSAAQHLELPAVKLLPGPPRGPAARADARDPLSLDDSDALPDVLRRILFGRPLDETLAVTPGLDRELLAAARDLAARAYPAERVTERQGARWIDHRTRDQHHRALVTLYQQHMRLPHQGMAVNQFHPLACELMLALEGPWERDMLARARRAYDLAPDALPVNAPEFAAWYQATAFGHPLYEHELYAFLANEAGRQQIEWFLRMESAGEAAFDDLVALGQVGTRGEVKIEMGRNYWDEMGNGRSHAVHTHLFHRLVEELGITAPAAHELPWQVLGGVNVMLWSCIARRNGFRAQGVLGAVELLAPQRCTRLVHGALRVGIPKKTMSYYAAHAIIDVNHAEGWLAHVIEAQVAAVPESRTDIAEGLLVRADASLDYFDWCLARARDEIPSGEQRVVSGE